MVSRIAACLIVSFWLVMSVLLIRLETNPNGSDLLTVPPSRVFKLMFTHEQTSDLNIVSNGITVGNIMIRPAAASGSDERTLVFTGGISLLLPGAPKKQRISWEGTLTLGPTFDSRNFQLALNLPESFLKIHLSLDSLHQRADYQIKEGEKTVRQASISTTQTGVLSLLREELGIEPAMLQNMPVKMAAPTLSAKQAELRIRKDKVIVYLLTIKQADTELAAIYVSQLGQILTAKTILGYSFSAEDLLPPP